MWFSQGVNGSDGWATYVHNNGGIYEHRFLKGGVEVTSSAIANTSNWEHVVWVVDSSSRPSLYINGRLRFSGPSSNTIASLVDSQPTFIGADQRPAGTASSLFRGQIDDVRLYDRALTAAEIAELYNRNR
jgi:hypothetical protein